MFWSYLLIVACETQPAAVATEPDASSPESCPTDVHAPIPKPTCGDDEESTAGKWTAEDEDRWRTASGPHDVIMLIRNGAKVCPNPMCPPRSNPCPELEETRRYREDWNWQSQTCVRQLIADIDGQATEERTPLVNFIQAYLTWSQIERVGAHPHVAHIENSQTNTPPP